MDIHILEATTHHALALTDLLKQLGYAADEAHVIDRIKTHGQPGYKILVAKSEEKIVGYIGLHLTYMLHHTNPIGRVTSFCVDESSRKEGVGSLLLAEAEKYFEQNRCVKIEVTSNTKRTGTHHYYLQRGYIQTSQHFVKLIQTS